MPEQQSHIVSHRLMQWFTYIELLQSPVIEFSNPVYIDCARCPACNGSRICRTYEIKQYHIGTCNDCGHKYVINAPHDEVLEEAYGKEYYQAGDSGNGYYDYIANIAKRERGFKQLLTKLESHVPVKGKILDIGCAVGLFVKVAVKAGWVASGIDRAVWAVKYGRENFNLDLLTTDEQYLLQPESFNVVTMWDVLEHLKHPTDVLKEANNFLVPGGLLALNTVNASSWGAKIAGENWRHLAPPHHLHYFSRNSLCEMLHNAGFTIDRFYLHGVFLEADKTRSDLTVIQSLIEELVTHWRVKIIAKQLDLLDEITVYAHKA